MRDTRHNLLVRGATGIVFVVVVLGAILWCNASYAVLLALVAVGCMVEFYRLGRTPAQKWLGMVYIALAVGLMSFFERPFATVFILTVWANDIFAYLVGITLGRHQMSPTLSPHKTWEGFVGGIIGAVGIALGLGKLLQSSPHPTTSLLMWAVFGLAIAIAAVAGDLLESHFKRAVGVKDSGRLLPGHGGLLDRFDAMMLASPVAFLFMILFLR